MLYKKPRARKKSFTLIEVLIAMTLFGLIMSQGLYLLSQQIKNQLKYTKAFEKFQTKELLLEELQGYFFHLVSSEKKCLISDSQSIALCFDAAVTLDPCLSGPLHAQLKLEGDKLKLITLIDDKIYHEKVIASHVKSFSVEFFSHQNLWQEVWSSETQGLPEMIHIQLTTDSLSCDQKFLLPFNLPPLPITCKSSLSSSL